MTTNHPSPFSDPNLISTGRFSVGKDGKTTIIDQTPQQEAAHRMMSAQWLAFLATLRLRRCSSKKQIDSKIDMLDRRFRTLLNSLDALDPGGTVHQDIGRTMAKVHEERTDLRALREERLQLEGTIKFLEIMHRQAVEDYQRLSQP
jgi:hypothetical protein